jgi:hypothetical protein
MLSCGRPSDPWRPSVGLSHWLTEQHVTTATLLALSDWGVGASELIMQLEGGRSAC